MMQLAWVSFRNKATGKYVLEGLFQPLPLVGSVVCGWRITDYDSVVMDSLPPQMSGEVEPFQQM